MILQSPINPISPFLFLTGKLSHTSAFSQYYFSISRLDSATSPISTQRMFWQSNDTCQVCVSLSNSNSQEGFALLPYVLLYRLLLHKFIFLSCMSFLQHFTDIVEFYLPPLPLVSNSKKAGMFASFCPLLFLLQCLEIAQDFLSWKISQIKDFFLKSVQKFYNHYNQSIMQGFHCQEICRQIGSQIYKRQIQKLASQSLGMIVKTSDRLPGLCSGILIPQTDCQSCAQEF